MSTMSVSAARRDLPSAIETARTEAVFLEREGTHAAVIISVERYEQLMDALEDVEDIAAADAAMSDPSPSTPWAQVKAELGW